MKRFFIIQTLVLASLPGFGADKVTLTVSGLSSGGRTLAEAVGDSRYEIDSLVVTDPEYRLTVYDMMFMRDCSERGRLTGIDLSGVRADGDSIPEYSFACSLVNMPGCGDGPNAAPEPRHPKLHYMKLPASLKKICDHAFCAGDLRAVDVPRSVEVLSSEAFDGCRNLKSVTLRGKDPLRILKDGVFLGISPDAVLRVTPGTGHVYSAHPEWGDFASISEDAGVFVTRSVALSGGMSLEQALGDYLSDTDSLILSGSVTAADLAYIRDLSVSGRTRLSGLNLTACTMDAVPDGAFENTNIMYCTLPVTVGRIGDRAFRNTTLESVSFQPLVRSLGSRSFEGCIYLRGDITVPEGCRSIGDGCFSGCISTCTVTLPSTLEAIGDGALSLPGGVAGLHDVYVNRLVPPSADGVTGPVVAGEGDMPASSRRLYVPVGAGAAYAAAPYWRDFGSIRETALLSGGPSAVDGVEAVTTDRTEVYTATGRLVWRGTGMPRLKKGLYIVRNGGRTVKTAVE